MTPLPKRKFSTRRTGMRKAAHAREFARRVLRPLIEKALSTTK